MCLEGNFSGGESSYWLISKGISSTSIYFQRQFACSHVRDCEKVTCKLIRIPLLSGRKITVLPPIWNAMILGSSFRWIEPSCPFLREGNVNRLDEKIFRSRCCAHWLISSPRRENNQVSSVSVCRAFELELSEVIVNFSGCWAWPRRIYIFSWCQANLFGNYFFLSFFLRSCVLINSSLARIFSYRAKKILSDV